MYYNRKIKTVKNYISEWEGMEYVDFWEDGGEGTVRLAELLGTFKGSSTKVGD